MEEAASLQTPVFCWDGDEERFAMERVHGVNDFVDEDQTKFSTMDEDNGDDDWRALAASQPPPEPVVEATETDPAPPPESNLNAHPSPQQLAVPAAATQHMQHTQVADIRIMRFTRKRTPNQRGRRHPALVMKQEDLLEKFPILKHLQQQEQQEQKEKEAVAAKGKEGVTATGSKKVEAGSKQPVAETKAKASPDAADNVVKGQRSVQARQIEADKKIIRPKQQLQQKVEDQQQNKKQKSLAFQKSRNIINKRINAESAKTEPALEVECSEVVAMQAKQKAVAVEFKALREEIRPLISSPEEEGLKGVPSNLQERWIELHCKHLRSNFDYHFAVTQHFLCHPPLGQCKAQN
ncbi:histone-lysine N-methyltransferase ASHH1-like isoform X1 [Selaginella moellendorffii]|uniref:histone-lysine N-methyltransferase ASHH1-like isoform X1 n=2 Tax=Selaginella moellendorffii TaxID=88036 RepID=UPI000D1C5114|nr:histone-lysine N-methyltransferase ASHH1-like isoform X1 [Selaginella moellendorffii]XP_024529141.1 histone-lysine N-methyltransferase ASHH1-like isoform X1 [Selaginella moellendorffii]|eukprot:XP_024529134.1 histone-lysine N-methyltransferase ASHH1-like isoform X1 [Selaginella moellendorffii]